MFEYPEPIDSLTLLAPKELPVPIEELPVAKQEDPEDRPTEEVPRDEVVELIREDEYPEEIEVDPEVGRVEEMFIYTELV